MTLKQACRAYLLGAKLHEIYPHCTPIKRLKFYIMRYIRMMRIVIVFCAIVYGIFQAGAIFGSSHSTIYERITTPAEAKEIIKDTLTDKIKDLKWQVIDNIKEWETKGISKDKCDGKIVFDTNKKASIGCFQYQVNTVIHYKKILDNEVISEKEAIAIAMDYEQARQLAYKIVWEKGQLQQNWYNYSKQASTITLLNTIKELE